MIKRRESGAWVQRTMKVRQSGAWVPVTLRKRVSGAWVPAVGSAFWTSIDIGGSATGSTDPADPTTDATIEGNGSDIWGDADAFRFVYVPVSGDCDMIVRLVSLENTAANNKAGIMLRETLDAGSIHVSSVQQGQSGQFRISRDTTNSGSDGDSFDNSSMPHWLRLTRTDGDVRLECSPDGSSWHNGRDRTFPTGAAYLGFCVCSNSNGVLCTAEFDNISVTI